MTMPSIKEIPNGTTKVGVYEIGLREIGVLEGAPLKVCH